MKALKLGQVRSCPTALTGSSAGPVHLCMVSWVAFQQEGCSETEAVAVIPDEKSFMTFGTSRLPD